MKWQVLILSQQSRNEMRADLLAELTKQMAGRDVVPLVMLYDPTLSLGDNRNRMLQLSRAEYVSFFDDDDWPAPDYVAKVLPLLDGVDYVGFQVQTYCAHFDYWPYGQTFHSLRYNDWSREGMNFYRDISHINPMRRELAIQGRFVDASKNFGEDANWAASMRKLGIVKTEHYIPEVMYHYIWRAMKRDSFDLADTRRINLVESIKGTNKSAHHSCPECEKAFGRPNAFAP